MKTPGLQSSWVLVVPLAAGVLALFAPGLLLGRLPVFRDLLVLVAPLRTYAAEAVRSGRLPLWTPDIFFGAPFLANYQSAVLYPPSAILYALPLVPGLTLFLALHVFVGGWGMTLYLRRRRGLEPLPALFGGILFALGGFLVSLVSLTNQLEVAVWLPWALDAAEDLQRTGRGRSLACLAFFFTLQALGGAPEAWLVSIAVVAGNGLAVAWERGAPRWRLVLPGAAVVLAAGLAAPQLLATFEYVAHTDRASTLPLAAVAAESFTPVSFLQLVLPHRFFSGSPGFLPERTLPLFWSLYLGIAGVAFALVAVARAPFSLWTIVLAASTLLALGSSTPLFGLLYSLAPKIVGAFRFPGKLFLGGHFALCLLAAEGLALATSRPSVTRAATAVSAAVFVLGAAIAIFAPLAPAPTLRALGYDLPAMAPGAYAIIAGQVAGTALRSAALAAGVVVLLSFLGRRALSSSAAAAGLCLITAVDLVTVHQPSLVFADWKRFEAAGEETAAALGRSSRVFHYCTAVPGCLPPGAPGLGSWKGSLPLGENVLERAFHLWTGLVFDVPLAYGLGAVDGGDGFLTRDQGEFFRALVALPRASALGVLAALGVDRLIGSEPLELPGLREIFARVDPPIRAYALSGAAPRSYLAERLLTAADVASAFATLGSSEFRPGRDAVLVAAEAAGPVSGGEIRDPVFFPERVAATLSLPGPGFWVVNDTSYPGWEATIDGGLVEILRVNAIARGIRVPAGEHRVEMLYRPWRRAWGAWGLAP